MYELDRACLVTAIVMSQNTIVGQLLKAMS
jgi:hypothetical protein